MCLGLSTGTLTIREPPDRSLSIRRGKNHVPGNRQSFPQSKSGVSAFGDISFPLRAGLRNIMGRPNSAGGSNFDEILSAASRRADLPEPLVPLHY